MVTSGAASSSQRYLPYGGQRGTAEVATDRRYTGQRWQAQFGLYDYSARWYDPELRRFVQPDTIVPEPGNPQSLTRYSYVLSNPTSYSDPSGQWAEGAYVSGITPDPKVVADATWWREYQQVEGRNPGPNSVGGYSAMRVMTQGVIEAKTLGVDAVGAAIRGLSLTTLIGPVHYDAKGDLTEQRIYVFQVRDNDFVQVKPAK